MAHTPSALFHPLMMLLHTPKTVRNKSFLSRYGFLAVLLAIVFGARQRGLITAF